MSVLAVRDYELIPSGPIPSGVVPDPPLYTACIARAQATSPAIKAPSAKRECQAKYDALREQVLGFLITGESLISEGEARHVSTSRGKLLRRFAKVKATEFDNSTAKLRTYFKLTGETMADQLFRARIKVSSETIEHGIMAAKGVSLTRREHELARFGEDVPVKWAAKTTCRSGYVVPNCKEYRGKLRPRIIL
jgi:hypothetical protein